MAFVMAAQNGVLALRWRNGNMPPALVNGMTDAGIEAFTADMPGLQKESRMDR